MAPKAFDQTPINHLPRSAYISDEWFQREQSELFSKTWSLVCMSFDLPNVGDYIAKTLGEYPLFVIRGQDGALKAFHNICRHRGTELLDQGTGNAGKTLVCPYHRWTYMLDGRLRGMPNQAECFPDIDKKSLGLKPIEIGIFKDMVFASPDPKYPFEDWIAPLRPAIYPHDIEAQNLTETIPMTYEIKCNWKVFFENAIDGYHLAYLHEHTLGGPIPTENIWEIHGENLAWYSTERDKVKNRIPKFVSDNVSALTPTIKDAKEPGYGGVYMLFPTTLITPSPWSLSVSRLEPISPDITLLHVRTWMPKMSAIFDGTMKDIAGYDEISGRIKSDNWTIPAMETGDFQIEDIYVCEKMQRSLHSPAYTVGPLASGAGAEAPISFFQQLLLNYMPLE